ncbi:MAG: hypothetical protein M1817_004838 [Caeruleum heppii]|nr:MAG: hypothetical protein M1817_004838 [Caeruleum heppii]
MDLTMMLKLFAVLWTVIVTIPRHEPIAGVPLTIEGFARFRTALLSASVTSLFGVAETPLYDDWPMFAERWIDPDYDPTKDHYRIPIHTFRPWVYEQPFPCRVPGTTEGDSPPGFWKSSLGPVVLFWAIILVDIALVIGLSSLGGAIARCWDNWMQERLWKGRIAVRTTVGTISLPSSPLVTLGHFLGLPDREGILPQSIMTMVSLYDPRQETVRLEKQMARLTRQVDWFSRPGQTCQCPVISDPFKAVELWRAPQECPDCQRYKTASAHLEKQLMVAVNDGYDQYRRCHHLEVERHVERQALEQRIAELEESLAGHEVLVSHHHRLTSKSEQQQEVIDKLQEQLLASEAALETERDDRNCLLTDLVRSSEALQKDVTLARGAVQLVVRRLRSMKQSRQEVTPADLSSEAVPTEDDHPVEPLGIPGPSVDKAVDRAPKRHGGPSTDAVPPLVDANDTDLESDSESSGEERKFGPKRKTRRGKGPRKRKPRPERNRGDRKRKYDKRHPPQDGDDDGDGTGEAPAQTVTVA